MFDRTWNVVGNSEPEHGCDHRGGCRYWRDASHGKKSKRVFLNRVVYSVDKLR